MTAPPTSPARAAHVADPAVTARSPRRVAVLGAGPVGLDAALALTDHDGTVTVYEAGDEAGAGVRAWGHVRLFTPWSMVVSDRMAAHVGGVPGPPDGCPTGDEVVDRLLAPVAAQLDVRLGTRVVGIAREGLLKHEEIGTPARGERPFRLLLQHADGTETVERADLVLDCTGTHGRANTLGDGGIPAPGERSVAGRITREIPRADAGWAGRSVLLVGAGKSAQTAARDLAATGADLTWAVRAAEPHWGAVPGDPLPQRQELVEVAERLRSGAAAGVRVRTGVVVEALRPHGDGVAVALRDRAGAVEEVAVDHVVGLTGYLGDTGLYAQLQVHECYATAAPMNLSAALMAAAGDGPADCLAQPSQGVDVLRSPEPDFFVLGSKSYGRSSAFLLRVGYEQVDEVARAYRPS